MKDNIVKICVVCKTKNVLIIFIIFIENVNRVILKESLKVIMILKKNKTTSTKMCAL